MCCLAQPCDKFSGLRHIGRSFGPNSKRNFSIFNLPQQNIAESACIFVIQSQVRGLFQHIKSMAEFDR